MKGLFAGCAVFLASIPLGGACARSLSTAKDSASAVSSAAPSLPSLPPLPAPDPQEGGTDGGGGRPAEAESEGIDGSTLRAGSPGAYAWMGPPVHDGGPPDAREDCEGDLRRAGVTFRPHALPVHREHGALCGAPQAVAYGKGPGGISYDPPPVLSCPMALALASFERILQEEARRTFDSEIVRVRQLGTYNCRVIAAFRSTASEHSFANAIDLAEFTLKNGTKVSVLHDFYKGEGAPPQPAGVFLRDVAHRAFEEEVFSNVLTPFWDAAHKDHLHLDLARYRVNGFRPHA